MRHQYQFDSDRDREWRVIKAVVWDACKVLFLVAMSLLLSAGIYYTACKGQKIDNKVERHINHILKP